MALNKVVLIVLPSPWLISDRDMPNAGVLYLAAFLRKHGVAVQIADLCGLPEDLWRIPEGDIYGISSTTPQFSSAIKVSHLLKARGGKVILGGPHPSAEPQASLEATGADCVVVGEGEEALLAIAQHGITVPIVRAGALATLDHVPWPARDLIDIFSYQKIGTNAVVGAGALKEEYILTSRGCPYACAFCAQQAVTEAKVRWRNLDDVEAEWRFLLEHYKVQRLYVYDDTFNLKSSRVLELCARLTQVRRDFEFDWHYLARAGMEPELFQATFAAGARQVTFGTEHVDDDILRRVNKMVTGRQNYSAIEYAKASGLRVRCQLIVGLPGETDATVQKLADFIQSAPADSFGVHIFVPLPGSPIWINPERFSFKFQRSQVYEHYQTIGRPDEWAAHVLHTNSEQVLQWAKYLKSVAGARHISNYDARLKINDKR